MPDGKKQEGKISAALLVIDVINRFEFPDGDQLLRRAEAMADKLAHLKARARKVGVPTVYVNDNFGDWHSDAAKLLGYCLRDDAPGRVFVAKLKPDQRDYFVLKPMHSAFYQTPRDYQVIVAEDCCAARSAREHTQAIAHIRNMADAKV